jgi:hypothetical protein
MNDQLNEVFAPPVGLRPVAKIDGSPLFGSDLLNSQYLKAIDKCGRTKAAFSQFESLLQKNKIIPCFLTRGFGGFIAWKVFAPVSGQSIMGFYDRRHGKVYILMSNNANIFSFVGNNFLGKLTIHELIHMFSNEKKALFLNMFKNELISYYKHLWQRIFSINEIPDKTAEKIVRFVFLQIENSNGFSTSSIMKYNALLNQELRPLTTNEAQFSELLTDYMVLIKIFTTSIDKFFQSRGKYKHIIEPMYHAYKDAFAMKNLTTVCIQELIYPSEVICIASEDMRYGNKALKAIARL